MNVAEEEAAKVRRKGRIRVQKFVMKQVEAGKENSGEGMKQIL